MIGEHVWKLAGPVLWSVAASAGKEKSAEAHPKQRALTFKRSWHIGAWRVIWLQNLQLK